MSSLKTTPSTARSGNADHASRVPTPPLQIASERLLGPGGELVILHQGRHYRLRVTQNGKLILTA